MGTDRTDLGRIEDKLDLIQEDIAEIKVDLRYHIKRTDLAEDRIELNSERLEEALLPIRWTKSTVKIIAVIGTIAGAILAIKEFL